MSTEPSFSCQAIAKAYADSYAEKTKIKFEKHLSIPSLGDPTYETFLYQSTSEHKQLLIQVNKNGLSMIVLELNMPEEVGVRPQIISVKERVRENLDTLHFSAPKADTESINEKAYKDLLDYVMAVLPPASRVDDSKAALVRKSGLSWQPQKIWAYENLQTLPLKRLLNCCRLSYGHNIDGKGLPVRIKVGNYHSVKEDEASGKNVADELILRLGRFKPETELTTDAVFKYPTIQRKNSVLRIPVAEENQALREFLGQIMDERMPTPKAEAKMAK